LRKGPRSAAGAEAGVGPEPSRPSEPPPFLPAAEEAEPAAASGEDRQTEPPARPVLRLAESNVPEEAMPEAAFAGAAETPGESAPGSVEEPAAPPEEVAAPNAEVWSDEIAAEPPTEAHPLFVVRADGALEIASPGVVYVRKGCVVWYSGNVRFTAEQAFRGTRLESILRADGRGYLFVNDPGRHAFRRDLSGQSLSLEGSRLLALDHGLSFRLEPIHDFRMNRRVDILRIQGQGSVILSVTGPLLAHEVSAEFPLIVSAHDLVAWSGNLLPAVLEDRFLEEVMQPDSAAAPKIRFEGEGTVLTEPPRPRRRATDRGAGAADRRRV